MRTHSVIYVIFLITRNKLIDIKKQKRVKRSQYYIVLVMKGNNDISLFCVRVVYDVQVMKIKDVKI